MGGCSTNKRKELVEDEIVQSIRWSLDSNNMGSIPNYLIHLDEITHSSIHTLNSSIFIHKNMKIPILGYTLCKNQLKQFKYLYEHLNAEPSTMEKAFNTYNETGISIICENNNIDFLEYYLPIYEEFDSQPANSKNNSTTVQKLALNGNLLMLSKIFKYFECKSYMPACLDLGYINKETGENTALCACRSGKFSIIKFLYERCKLDFTLVNSAGENALTIILRSGNTEKGYWASFVFIKKVIGIEVQNILTADELNLLSRILNE